MPNSGAANFSVTPGTANAIIFGDLALRGTRNALYSASGTPDYEYSTWHIPGTTGKVVCNLGEENRTIMLAAVYIGSYPGILTTYENDKIAMAGVPCNVTDAAGKTHTRCRLKAATENAPPKGANEGANGATPIAFFVAQFVFDRHGVTT
jgi:hypothetical protein